MNWKRKVESFGTDKELEDFLNAHSGWRVLHVSFNGHAEIGWAWSLVIEEEV